MTRYSLGINLTVLVRTFFSYETLLAAFLYSGIFKESPRFSFVPIDITILFSALVCLGFFYISWKRQIVLTKRALMFLGAVCLFHIWAGLSLLWTPSFEASIEKYYLLLFNHIPAILGAIIVASNEVRVRRFFLTLVLFSVWFAVETIFTVVQSWESSEFFLSVLSGGYQFITVAIGVGVVVLFLETLSRVRGVKTIIYLGLLILILSISLTVVGGRSAIVSVIFCMFLAFIVGLRWFRGGDMTYSRAFWRGGLSVFGGFLLLQGLIAFRDRLPSGLARIALAVLDPAESAGGRLEFLQQAFSSWAAHPVLGVGINGWSVDNGYGEMTSQYPHNTFVEIFSDLGLVGAFIFYGMIFIAIHSILKYRKIYFAHVAIITWLIMYISFTMVFSGTIINKIFFCFLSLTMFREIYLLKNQNLSGVEVDRKK